MLLFMVALSAVATFIAYQKGVLSAGFSQSGALLMQVLPILVPAFILAGMVGVIVPMEAMTRLLGADSGLRGLVFATFAGAVTPGGPFLAFPLLAVLLKGGVSVGAVTAYLSAWALLGVHRVLAFEIPILGARFVLVRFVASLIAPVLIGWLAQALWTRFGAPT